MGAFFSCPLAKDIDVRNGVESESITVKFISFGDDEVEALEQSSSSNSGDFEPTIIKSVGLGKTALESSVSFKSRDFNLREEELDVVANSSKRKYMENQSPRPESRDGIQSMMDLVPSPTNLEHMAATELQKVYKSFRTRRRLADCAVLAEESWWKLLNFAELKRSSISFFDIEKRETPISRWSRARTRAAMVGKGLLKNDKAQMLALQHWLEAVKLIRDIVMARTCSSIMINGFIVRVNNPFSIGEGKEVDLVEECSRVKLQQQCINYLGPMERTAYEVVVVDGKFIYKQSGELLHTTRVNKHEKWIFVLSTSKTLYVGKKMKGTFHHSSFLAGGATLAAGRLVVENGILQEVWPHSGHYRPTEENFHEFISFLTENNVDLSHVKLIPRDEDDNVLQIQKTSLHVRIGSTEEDWVQQLSGDSDDGDPEIVAEEMIGGKSDFPEQETSSTIKTFEPNRTINLSRKLTNIHISDKSNLNEKLEMENQEMRSVTTASELDTEAPEKNLLEEENRNCEVDIIPDESIVKRINSHKDAQSYQLGRQLPCKWTTGAGPRIGCVRDYPVELQLRALKQVSL